MFCVSKFKVLWRASLFTTAAEFVLGVLDCVMAGNLFGAKALGAVNLVNPVSEIASFVAFLVAAGMQVCYSVENGRMNERRAHEYFTQAIHTVFIIGGVLITAMITMRGLYFDYLAPAADLRALAETYWNWYIPCMILEPMNVLLVYMCYADGDTRTCIASYTAQMITFITTAIVFAGVLGVGSCALAMAAGNVVASSIMMSHFFKKTNTFKLVRHFSWSDSFHIVIHSVGDAGAYLGAAILIFFLNKFFISHFGAESLPVLSVAIVTFTFGDVLNGVGSALAPLAAVYVGENNTRAIRILMRTAVKLASMEALALSLLFLAFPQLMVRFVGITEPELVPLACTAVRIVSLGYIGIALVYLFNSYYLFINRKVLSVALTFVCMLIGPVIFISSFGAHSFNHMWAMMAVAPSVTLIGFFIFMRFRYGQQLFPLLLSRNYDIDIHFFNLTLDELSIADISRRVALAARKHCLSHQLAMRAALITEEVLMTVRDRNAPRSIHAEVTFDFTSDPRLTLRDDGEIFDITDTDAKISSLRAYIVASVMAHQTSRANLITTGFNRNVFKFTE